MEDKIWNILESTRLGYITVNEGTQKVLDLFAVMESTSPTIDDIVYDNLKDKWIHKYTKKEYYNHELIGKHGLTADELIKHLP